MDDDFWESLRQDFTQLRADCAIDPPFKPAGRLTAIWNAPPAKRTWRFNYHNGKDGNGVTKRFEWAADCAATRLGFMGPEGQGVFFWLDRIKSDAPPSHIRAMTAPRGNGEADKICLVEILDICGLSSDYCRKCQADEMRSLGVGGEGKRVAPDQLRLPALPAAVDYDLTIAVTEARVQLYEELNRAWTICFPKEIPIDRNGNLLVRVDPTTFFPPFVAFGVKYYDAYAEALIQLRPTYSDYEAWINFALKTRVCDELAPCRAVGERHQRLSQWQLHMGATWRVFDHPNHSALYPAANKLINGLENVMEPLWEMFLDALHNAISRRTLPLMAEGLKQLRRAAPAPSPVPIGPSPEAGTSAAVEFPKRAQWLADRLRERSWNKHDLSSHGGPDHKTGQKVLDGRPVRADVLEKISTALSIKFGKVSVLEIPTD